MFALEPPPLPISVHWVDGDWWHAWLDCLGEADAVLPIAPETDGVLEALCRSVSDAGKLLLNSGAEAVAIASSKKTTVDCLAVQGVPVISTWRADKMPSVDCYTMVVKTGSGCGLPGYPYYCG